jgi:hypothetical protein
MKRINTAPNAKRPISITTIAAAKAAADIFSS